MRQADLLSPAADWQHENWAERINACASMLFLHGYIPLSQREKIGKKLEAQFASAIEAATAGETPSGSIEGESAAPNGGDAQS